MIDSMKQVNLAKWYVKQVLDAIDCEDQTNENLAGVNTCLYLNIEFEHLERLTKNVIPNYFKNNTQEYIDQICIYTNIKDLYKQYIYKYKVICLKHVDQEFISWPKEFARYYLNIVVSDIYNIEDSRDYPKGLQTTSEYFEDIFKEHVTTYQSIKAEDFSIVAKIFDSKMSELKIKIKKQRELDGI